MSEKGNAIAALILVILLSGGFAATSSNSTSTNPDESGSSGGDPPTSPPSECSDGIDNDNDGFTDEADPDCDTTNPNYTGNESGV